MLRRFVPIIHQDLQFIIPLEPKTTKTIKEKPEDEKSAQTVGEVTPPAGHGITYEQMTLGW
jgi:hypothetical protein